MSKKKHKEIKPRILYKISVTDDPSDDIWVEGDLRALGEYIGNPNGKLSVYRAHKLPVSHEEIMKELGLDKVKPKKRRY